MSRAPESAIELRARALRLLARREHSRVELSRKLAAQTASSKAVAQVLDALEAKKQLSEERFAEERARQLSRKFGSARIRQDLLSKGVSVPIAGRIAGESGEGDLARARSILVRKYRSSASNMQERAKRGRFLESRGFSRDTIRKALGDDLTSS